MRKISRKNSSSRRCMILLLCALACLLTACGTQQPAMSNQNAPLSAPGKIQTVCPKTGTGRAAVMTPLALSNHPTLVYDENASSSSTSASQTFGHLKRYDLTTSQKTTVVTSKARILLAQLSHDGQWILFLSGNISPGQPGHLMLQLVRLDGQALQTLYCFPDQPSIGNIRLQWSDDQRFVAFSYDRYHEGSVAGSTVMVLDTGSGALQTELETQNTAAQVLTSYQAEGWLTRTQLYIGYYANVYLTSLKVLDLTAKHSLQGSGLKKVFDSPAGNGFFTWQKSNDSAQLFLSQCTYTSTSSDSVIWTMPASGGEQKMIYHNTPSVCITDFRIASSRALLLLVLNKESSQNTVEQVVKLNTDGQRPVKVADIDVNQFYSWKLFDIAPWANVSRDSSMYALHEMHRDSPMQQVLIGAVTGGALQTVESTTTDDLNLVGWTME